MGTMKYSNTFLMFVIFVSIVVLLFLNLVLGSVSIPFHSVWNIICGNGDEPVTWQNIIWKSRFPQALTALVAGAGLAISGLQMQTVFRNPLAGPSVLGISSGASMGVAFVVLLSGSLGGVALSKLGFMGEIALSIAAIVGSLSVMALIVYVSQKVKGNVTLLIIGVMIGYVANAVIGVLKFFSVEEDIRAYVIWGLGSFSRVSGNQMMLFVAIMAILIPLSFLLIKTLNLMLLGDGYARNLGLNIKRARLLVITSAGVLTAIVTAYCGPIVFLGLAVPHLCRAIFQTSDHRILMPGVLFVGAALAVAGVLIQGIVRNPLASPDILGVNHAASLASVGALLLMPSLPVMVLPLLAFAGGMAGLLLLKMLAKTHQPMKLALTGVALSACWASLTDYLMLSRPQDVNNALLWLTGSLWGRDWSFVKIAIPLMILFLPLSLSFCRDLDLLALGDARATTLGVSVPHTRFWALLLAVAMTSTGVAACGPISFIGLVVPHMMRSITGGRHRRLLPVSALTGALLLVVADLLARIIHPPLELPVGVLTAIIGAPWFVWLLVRMR